MQRLTKTQKEIEELAKRVPRLTDKQKEWARRNFNYFRVVRQGETEVRCPDCKCVFPIKENVRKSGSKWNKNDKTITCPHCGATIQLRTNPADYNPSHNNKQNDFFQVMNVVGGWQVTRLFYMERYCYAKKDNTPWEFWEVCQAWNNPEHKKTHFRAFPKTCMPTYHFNPYKLWEWSGRWDNETKQWVYTGATPCELTPRRVGGSNYFETTAICPGGRILPAFQKRGITRQALSKLEHNAMWLFECVSEGNTKPMYETLLKCGDYTMFNKVTDYHYKDKADAYFTAWKICRRNGYDYKRNEIEWYDYISLVIKRGLDYHNPHYVCPADLHGAHNHLLALERREEEIREERLRRERDERARREAEEAMKNKAKANKSFIKRRKAYFGLCIVAEQFKIVVLKSVNEFKEEGLYLDHCVFRAGYYQRENSLILSARDENNNPIETIEVNLRNFTISQCYGYSDEFSSLHKEILATMNENMWRVKEIAQKQKRVA